MKLQVCAIYDSKARAFLFPMFFGHVDLAKRSFSDAANKPEHGFSNNPEDFTLFHLGEWDDGTGKFQEFEQHRNLGLAAAYKRS